MTIIPRYTVSNASRLTCPILLHRILLNSCYRGLQFLSKNWCWLLWRFGSLTISVVLTNYSVPYSEWPLDSQHKHNSKPNTSHTGIHCHRLSTSRQFSRLHCSAFQSSSTNFLLWFDLVQTVLPMPTFEALALRFKPCSEWLPARIGWVYICLINTALRVHTTWVLTLW